MYNHVDFWFKIAYNKYKLTRNADLIMIVTATEFKTNFGKYLDMVAEEDISITHNGKTIAKIVNPQIYAVDSLREMLKDIPSDIDIDSLREKRLYMQTNEQELLRHSA